TNQVALANMDLGRILDDHDALLVRNEVTENVEQGGFPRARSARDEDVLALADLLLEQFGQFWVNGAEFDEVLNGEMPGREFPDGEGDPALATRWYDSR